MSKKFSYFVFFASITQISGLYSYPPEDKSEIKIYHDYHHLKMRIASPKFFLVLREWLAERQADVFRKRIEAQSKYDYEKAWDKYVEKLEQK